VAAMRPSSEARQIRIGQTLPEASDRGVRPLIEVHLKRVRHLYTMTAAA
jgi:hypothetical protein